MNAQQKKYDDPENDLKCTFTCDPPQRQATRDINNQEHDAYRDEHERPQPNERQVTFDVERNENRNRPVCGIIGGD